MIPYYDTCNVTALQQAQIFNYTWVSIISLVNRKQLFNVILTSLLSSYLLIKISTQKYDICKSAPQIIEAWRAIAPVPFVCPTYPYKKAYQILMNSVLHSMIIDTNRRLLTEPFYQTQYSCTIVLFVRYWQGDWVPHSNTFCLFSAVEANTIVKSIFLPIPFLKELNKELNTAVLYGNYSYCFCGYLTA